jgi:Na+/phosphate symporter
MGLAFLPWERLPAWLLGPLLVAIGVFLLLHAEPFSWRQVESVGLILIGIGVFIYGVKKLRARPKTDAGNKK